MSSSSKDGILAVAGSFVGLTTIAIVMRFTARKHQKSALMMDDWMTVPALVSYIAAAICIFISVHDKILGYSSSDFTPAQTAAMQETAAKLTVALDVFTNLALAFTKLSALAFYRRTFCGTGSLYKGLNIIIIASMIVVAAWVVTFNFMAGFQCGTHFSALWDGSYLEYCHVSFPYVYGSTVSDFLLDLWILVLPIYSIMKIHTTLSKRLSIVGVFLLTFVGLGASIARVVDVVQVELGGATYFLHHDEERANTQVLYLIMLEAGISLIAVNLPPMWRLCTSVIPERVMQSLRFISSKASSRSRSYRTNSDATADTTTEFKGMPTVTHRTYASETVCSGPDAGQDVDLEANTLRGSDSSFKAPSPVDE